jgi:MFS family permease
LNQLMITIGILLSYIVSVIFAPIEGWRYMFAVALVPALVLGIGMFMLPRARAGSSSTAGWTRPAPCWDAPEVPRK